MVFSTAHKYELQLQCDGALDLVSFQISLWLMTKDRCHSGLSPAGAEGPRDPKKMATNEIRTNKVS